MSEEEKRVGQICLSWWRHWIDRDDGAARASVARLRRVKSPLDAALIPAVHALNRSLAEAGHDLRARPDRLALIACALAACHHTPHRRTAQVFGAPPDQPAVSNLRFNALVREADPNRLRQPLVRALGQVKGAVDVAALADDLFHWGEDVRTRWAFEYFGAGASAPIVNEETLT